jgi:hypothetical protein
MKSGRSFIMRSQTTAIKAKRLLYAHGISSVVYKSTLASGCAYAVSVSPTDYEKALAVITAEGIEFTIG